MKAPVVLLLAVSCANPSSPARSASPEGTELPVTTAMHRQLILVDTMRESVIAADLDAAGRASRKLAAMPEVAGAPPEWGPWLARVRDSAARVDDTWTLQTAARTVADIGRTCGGCHASTGGGPRFGNDGTPAAPKEGLRGHMVHHKAAVDGMWEGLITADTLHFARAAKALSEERPELADGPQGKRLHDLAGQAAKAKSLASRADVFGEVIAACAECHAGRDAVRKGQ